MVQLISRALVIFIVLMFLCEQGYTLKIFHRGKDGKYRGSATQFAFAKHFQNHMVLQQAPARANIYGFSPDIGESVTLQLISSQQPILYESKVTQGPEPGVGVWNFILDPLKGNTAVNITVASKGVTLSLTDVLIGDVWICSGQSNMEFTVAQMRDAADELADAHNYPHIRIMTVENAESPTPLNDLGLVRQAWTLPSSVTLGGPIWTYFSAVCWLYGKAIHKALGFPVGLVATDYGGTPAEAWSPPEALRSCNITSSSKKVDEILRGPRGNSVLWNAMVNPLVGMTIKGAIWYQGESDASGDMMTRYKCTFTNMIHQWRAYFHNASNGQTDIRFPFGFVQLAPNRQEGSSRGFPDIRWHQTADRGYVPNADMENVFMAVAIDLPDFNATYGAIHPGYKKDVAYRLALSGLAVAYGRNVVFQGPVPETSQITPQGVVISYGKTWTLDIRTTTGFELLCVNSKQQAYVATNITANNDTTITLAQTCPSGRHATGVRYAWRESPCEFKKCAVYETVNGLPGPPVIFKLPTNGTIKVDFHYELDDVYHMLS